VTVTWDGRPRLSARCWVTIPPDAHLWVARVPLHSVAVPDNAHPMDLDHVAAVTAWMLQTGADAPPVLLLDRRSSSRFVPCWLIEGRHRYTAALAAGRPDILATITNRIELVELIDHANEAP
jgi:hypothetical protein